MPEAAECMRRCLTSASPSTASDGNRQRREAASESDLVQLVSLGPLFLGHDDAELGDTLCAKQNKGELSDDKTTVPMGWTNDSAVVVCQRFR